jgi:DNA replication protein DnaC
MSNDLSTQLSSLGLKYTSEHLDDLIANATKKRWGSRELLEHIAAHEQRDKARRSVEHRLDRSHIGRFKPMADFDWNWPKRLERTAVEAALNLDFLEKKRNVVLIAGQGLGKTMIAQNIAYNAVQAGHSALFASASNVLLDLSGQETARGLDRRLKYYGNKVGLLILDEVGYLSYDSRNADLLFQIVSRRYENKSLVLTTNLPFSEWPSVFPNAACAIAMIDRLIHHADIIKLEGESYRRREAEEQKTERRAKRGKSVDP